MVDPWVMSEKENELNVNYRVGQAPNHVVWFE